MNTILQKRIEEAAEKSVLEEIPPYITSDSVNDSEIECAYKRAQEIFIAGANFALQNQWISVDERLPNIDEEDKQYSVNVFARTKDCIRYAYYDFYNESWCSVEGGYRFGGDVTHWMPIPSLDGGEK